MAILSDAQLQHHRDRLTHCEPEDRQDLCIELIDALDTIQARDFAIQVLENTLADTDGSLTEVLDVLEQIYSLHPYCELHELLRKHGREV